MTRYFLHRLQGEHFLLEAALAQEGRRPAPDERALKAMKRRKLLVKDRLQALERSADAGGLHGRSVVPGASPPAGEGYGAARFPTADQFDGSLP